MDRPRFPLSLRNLLWAMTWMAIWFGTIGFVIHLDRIGFKDYEHFTPAGVILLEIATSFAFIALPFAALGSIRGQRKGGLPFGIKASLIVMATLVSTILIGVSSYMIIDAVTRP